MTAVAIGSVTMGASSASLVTTAEAPAGSLVGVLFLTAALTSTTFTVSDGTNAYSQWFKSVNSGGHSAVAVVDTAAPIGAELASGSTLTLGGWTAVTFGTAIAFYIANAAATPRDQHAQSGNSTGTSFGSTITPTAQPSTVMAALKVRNASTITDDGTFSNIYIDAAAPNTTKLLDTKDITVTTAQGYGASWSTQEYEAALFNYLTTGGGTVWQGSAALTVTGAASTPAALRASAAAALSGAAALAARLAGPLPISAGLSAAASLAVSASLRLTASSTLTGGATAADAPQQLFAASATLPGVVTFTDAASLRLTATAALSVAGTLNDAASLRATGSAALSGLATLSAVGTLRLVSGAGPAGLFTLNANATILGPSESAALAGFGTLAASGALMLAATTGLGGISVVTSSASLLSPASASLAGAAALGGYLNGVLVSEAELQGLADAFSAATLFAAVTGDLAGVFAISALATVLSPASAPTAFDVANYWRTIHGPPSTEPLPTPPDLLGWWKTIHR